MPPGGFRRFSKLKYVYTFKMYVTVAIYTKRYEILFGVVTKLRAI
jgi:hypothetical protein